mgnify:CR=1 FL=1
MTFFNLFGVCLIIGSTTVVIWQLESLLRRNVDPKFLIATMIVGGLLILSLSYP